MKKEKALLRALKEKKINTQAQQENARIYINGLKQLLNNLD